MGQRRLSPEAQQARGAGVPADGLQHDVVARLAAAAGLQLSR
ncbi:hypothetical protein [Saccharopolyspora antimicrobica]|nr:hypothetical protein [Saccharopolyspora antimicrobica]